MEPAIDVNATLQRLRGFVRSLSCPALQALDGEFLHSKVKEPRDKLLAVLSKRIRKLGSYILGQP